MNIKVIGTGCEKCDKLYANVQEAVNRVGCEAEIEKIEDLMEIVKLGVMTSPSLMIDGKLVVSGRIAKAEEIEKLIIDKAKKFRVGDPTDPSVDIGPVIDEYAFNKVSSYIKKGINEGARMILGDIPDKNQEGYFIKPVVFMDVQNDMTIAREEIFGPVLSVITYHTVEEAIEIANDSKYGLCGGVFGNKEKAINIAREIESGTIRINGAPFALGAPFGGYKQSGIGREVGIQSFDECLEIKAINVF